jgi:serine phosphatase RsbU (regulator of sigma subunit)/anti-sigma regulatory factor (Ser/Thr protein kinase)
VHGPGTFVDKVGWVVSAVRGLTAADFAAYAEYEEGEARIVVSEGAPAAEISRVAESHLGTVVRSAIAAGGVPTDPEADELIDLATGPSAPPETDPRRTSPLPPLPRRSGRRGAVAPHHRWPSQVGVAVLGSDGNLHGAIILGHSAASHFSDIDHAVVRTLTAHLGIALDNLATLTRLAELEATTREAAHQLQYAVLPPTPSVEGAELGRCYVAADPSSPTGGDLYDWLVLPDGDLHVVVVDVLGKGVAATKDALAITHALRLLVLDGCPLDDLVGRADRLVTDQNPDLVATVLVGRFSPATGEMRLAGGGHPPALLVRSGGEVSEVDAPGVAIGWPGAGSQRVAKVQLERSDTVILYTDGLVEATKDITVGLETLARAAAETADYPAAQLARALVDRALAGAERRDDSLAVVVRRRASLEHDGAHRLGPFEHRFTPNLAVVPLARHLFSDWLERQPLDPAELGNLLLVASELCSNAVKASTGAEGAVVLRAWASGDSIVIEVEDDGPGFDWPVWAEEEVPSPDIEQGRGLFLVSALTDDVAVERRDDRTIVRGVKRHILARADPSRAGAG